jgi:hypothetical protein
MGWAKFWGDYFTNSSGHPDEGSAPPSCDVTIFFVFFWLAVSFSAKRHNTCAAACNRSFAAGTERFILPFCENNNDDNNNDNDNNNNDNNDNNNSDDSNNNNNDNNNDNNNNFFGGRIKSFTLSGNATRSC